ncbi:MAG: TRAP transporter TatT component family protein [Myxococcota bacterium]
MLAPACNLRQLTVDQTADVLAAGKPALDREEDVDLMREALPAQIKMVDAFLEVSPRNEELLALGAQASAEYAFGFVEDAMEVAAATDPDRAQELRRRARALYLRGMKLGLRILAEEDDRFPGVFYGPDAPLREAVAELDEDAVAGLFWTAFGLGGAINLGKDEPWLIAWLPKVEILMARVEKLDESFHHAGPLLTFGAFWASRTPMFGGNPELGKKYFERAIAREPAFQMTKVLYARTYAVQTQNRALYQKLLGEVLAANVDAAPEIRLANLLARKRAKRYLAEVDDLF